MYFKIANNFSKTPGGRNISEGRYSGEEFRLFYLERFIRMPEVTTLDFDGSYGYAGCFLEESFGGLVRSGYSKEKIFNTFEIISNDDPKIIEEITKYISEEEERNEEYKRRREIKYY